MNEVKRSAVISEDGLYRYRLDRWWGDGPRVAWVMLNPSTADAEVDDPTIRRVMRFSRDWGHDGLTVVNVYPFRAAKPRDLRYWLKTGAINPPLIKNGAVLNGVVALAPLVIAAWGAGADPDSVLPPRPEWHHLGLTNDGHPRHPLYVRADTKPIAIASGNSVAKREELPPSDGRNLVTQ